MSEAVARLEARWVGLVRRAAVEARRLSWLWLAAFATYAVSTLAHAQDVETAGAYYTDDILTSTILSVRASHATRTLWKGAGRTTSARVGATVKLVEFKAAPDLLTKQLDGETQIQETSLSASADQGLGVGTQVGLLAGSTQSPLSRVRYIGARAGQWWLRETLQTTFEMRKTSVNQPPLDYTDTDGQRVVTPEDLNGLNAAVTATHFTTPTTISRATYSRTTRSDRPPAWALGLEGRQFLPWTPAAVHVGFTHYENVGQITAATSYGSVVANTAKIEWHQRLPHRLILMGGYRYYLEGENPRATDAEQRQLGSDSVYGSLRWRMGRGAWTADAPELYGFAGRYASNAPNTAYLLGLGARFLL